jgi:hypothetical protein
MASTMPQRMHFPSVILSGVGAHATTESKDPGAASCKDVDSGNFCDDRLLFSFRAQRGNLLYTWNAFHKHLESHLPGHTPDCQYAFFG